MQHHREDRASTRTVKRQARHVVESARQAAIACVDDQRVVAADRVATAGKTARDIGETLRREGAVPLGWLAGSAADGLDRAAGYLRDTDTAGLISDARDLARANPAIVFGSAFVVGLLLGRFARSSERRLGSPLREGGSSSYGGWS
jgi:hypothetical protein